MQKLRRAFSLILIVLASSAQAQAAVTPGSPLTNEEIGTRQRFFGSANVDPANGAVRRDRVILSWAGLSTFAAAIAGHVVLLDAYVPQTSHPGYVPTTWEELAGLRPEAIFLGHAHFDHLGHAGPIAAATGAVVAGTVEHCEEARATAPAGSHVPCVAPLRRTTPFGEVVRRDELLGGVEINLVRHRHSPGLSPESVSDLSLVSSQPGDRGCVGHLDPRVYLEHLTPDSEEVRFELQNGLNDVLAGGGDGGVVLHQFNVGGFSLVYEDTSAAYDESPAELKASLAALPATDVLVGSVASLNSGARCMRDPRQYAEALRAKMFVPNHHDPYSLQPLSGPAGAAGEELEREFSRVPPERRPCLRYISDPEDYVRPERLTFDLADADPCSEGVQSAGEAAVPPRLSVRALVRRRTLHVRVRGPRVSRVRIDLRSRGRLVARRRVRECRRGVCRARFADLRAGLYRLRVVATSAAGTLHAGKSVRVR